ncbi:hypothetical protein D3C75_1024980 [compost metagenome]
MLPDLVALGYLRQTKAVRKDRLDVRFVRQPVGKPNHHRGALLRKTEEAHLIPAQRHGQRHAGQGRQIGVGLAIDAQHLQVHGEARAKVVADPGAGWRIGHTDYPGEAWQVVTTRQFRECALNGANDHVFHRMPI